MRVRRGWYVSGADWEDLWPEGRHLIHVVAVHLDASLTTRTVFSHESAAVLWGLPLYRFAPRRVHTLRSDSSYCASVPDVFRHRGQLADSDVEEVDGIPCTSLARTVLDLAASMPPEAGIAAADAALRRVAFTGAEYDLSTAEKWRSEMAQRAAMSAARGVRRARWIANFADGRAQLPGESVSRLYLDRMGFADIELQVSVPAPHGSQYRMDFGIPALRLFGEFDGRDKYFDIAMRGGRSKEQVFLAEKRREDYVRAVTGWRVVRWGSEHIRSELTFLQHLAELDVRVPRSRRFSA